ncbi:MAG: hypothetical protein QM676_08405 [Novosphingobium sp.]
MAREAAPGWADEAIELFGYNAEDVIAQQVAAHAYPERYSFEFCLKEIRKRRKHSALASPSVLQRLLAAARKSDSRSPAEA